MAALSLVSVIGTSPDAAGHPRAKRIPFRSVLNNACTDAADRNTEHVANDNAIPACTVGQLQRRLGCSRTVAWRILDGARPLTVAEAAMLARRAA